MRGEGEGEAHLSSRAERRAVLVAVAGDDEAADAPHLLDEVAVAEERLGEGVLDVAVDVVDEHLGGARPGRPGARRHARGVDRPHPPRRLRRPPRRRVHHDEVPLHLVEHRREPAEGEAARRGGGGGEVRLGRAGRLVAEGDELVGVGDAGVVGDVVGLEPRVARLDGGDPGRVLLEEHGAAAVVERRPHGAVEAQAEHQEVARRPPLQHPQRHPDLRRSLLRRHVRRRVVHHRLRHRRRELPAARLRRLPRRRRRRRRRRERQRPDGEQQQQRGEAADEEEAEAAEALELGLHGDEVDRLANMHGARHGDQIKVSHLSWPSSIEFLNEAKILQIYGFFFSFCLVMMLEGEAKEDMGMEVEDDDDEDGVW